MIYSVICISLVTQLVMESLHYALNVQRLEPSKIHSNVVATLFYTLIYVLHKGNVTLTQHCYTLNSIKYLLHLYQCLIPVLMMSVKAQITPGCCDLHNVLT